MVYYHEMIPFLVGLAIIVLLAVYSFRRSHMHMASTFGWLMVAVGFWVATYLLDLANTDYHVKLFWLKLKYVGATASAVMWLKLALVFTHKERWLNKTFYVLTGAWSATVVLLAFTNEWHHLFWVSYDSVPGVMESVTVHGPLFLLYALGGAGVVPASIAIYASHLVQVQKFYRYRAIMFILGGCLPVLGNVAHVYGYPLVPNVDQVPLMLVIGCCFYAVAIFRYQALDVLKVAQNLVIDSVNAGVVVVDHNRMILGFNPYAADVFAKARVNLDIEDLVPEVHNLELQDNQEFEISTTEAEPRCFLVKVSEIENTRVGKLGHALILFDITARKNAEESKTRFFANMSHELRTPLHGITGLLELIKHTHDRSKQLNYIEQAEASADLLQSLINDVLDLSRAEAERLNFESVPFDLKDILTSVKNVLSRQAEEKHLEFSVSYDRNTIGPFHLKGDPLRLTQVINNLGSNAIKFTASGKVDIAAKVIASREDSLTLEFSIADTGPGIPLERQAAMFEPFTQADTSTTREFGGSGLGLAIAQQLVEGMGGKIRVQSEPEKGSRFSFNLDLPISSVNAASQTDLVSIPSNLANRRVLVVDDSSVNRQVAEDFLLRAGMHVELAEGGEEAIALAQELNLDVILMDIHMPGMDGRAASQQIKLGQPDLPIVAMTASAFQEDKALAISSGMSDFIAKPFQSSDLYSVLARCLPAFNNPASETLQQTSTQLSSETRKQLLQNLHRDVSLRFENLQDNDADWSEFIHFVVGSAGFLGATELLDAAKDVNVKADRNFGLARDNIQYALNSLASKTTHL